MLFRKRRKSPARRPQGGDTGGRRGLEPDSYLITYDMMEKGAEVVRRGRKVKQVAVIVATNVVLVTSGDRVGRPIYEALVASGAVRAPKPPAEEAAPPAQPEELPPHQDED